MKKDRVCKYCGTKFEMTEGKVFSNHVRWCDKNTTNGDKGRSNLRKAVDGYLGPIKTFTLICSKDECNNEYQVNCREHQLDKQKKYCSRSCSNSIGAAVERIWTDEMRLSCSIRSKKMWENDDYVNKIINSKTKKRSFTSKGEEEVKAHFKTTYPDDGWTHGGSLKHNDERLVRDLFSKKLKICIEYDGDWHFKDINGQLERKQRKDRALEDWCVVNKWTLIRIDEKEYKKDKSGAIIQLESLVYSSLTLPTIIKIGNRY